MKYVIINKITLILLSYRLGNNFRSKRSHSNGNPGFATNGNNVNNKALSMFNVVLIS